MSLSDDRWLVWKSGKWSWDDNRAIGFLFTIDFVVQSRFPLSLGSFPVSKVLEKQKDKELYCLKNPDRFLTDSETAEI